MLACVQSVGFESHETQTQRLKQGGGMRFMRWGPAVVVAAFVLAACGFGGTSSSSTSGPVKIGVPVPLSGDLTNFGQDLGNGAKLAAADINSKGGIKGGQVQILEEDDQCDAQVGVQAAEKLVTEGIVGIVGSFCSGAAIPESGVLRQHGDLPFIAPTASNPKFTEQGYDNVYRIGFRDDSEAPIDAAYIRDYLKATHVAILHDNTTFAKGLADLVKAQLPASDVVFYDAITPGQRDYSATMVRIASKSPDVLYYTGLYPEWSVIIQNYTALKYTFKLFGGGATADPSVIKVVGDAINNPNITSVTAPTLDLMTNVQQYSANYKKTFNQDPGQYGVFEYDAVEAFAAAANKAGSLKGSDLNAALHSNSYDGLSGTVSFDAKGDRKSLPPFFAITGQNKQYVVAVKYLNGAWAAA